MLRSFFRRGLGLIRQLHGALQLIPGNRLQQAGQTGALGGHPPIIGAVFESLQHQQWNDGSRKAAYFLDRTS